MRTFSRIAGAALATTMSLAILAPAGQAATTRTVYAGYEGGTGVFKNLDTNSFFRPQVTIHVGDSVKWEIRGFHDIAFLGGTKRPELVVPNLASPITGPLDSAGAPYWYFGQPHLDFNPMIAFPAGPKTFSKKAFIGSGLPLSDGKPAPFKLKFNTKGTFTYYCLVHPGMAARVKVVGSHSHIPTARQNASAAKSQLRKIVTSAAAKVRLPATAANTVEAGRSTSEYSVERFFPASLTVKVGEPVTFTMQKDGPSEIHTVTFGSAMVTAPVEKGFITPVPAATGGPPELQFDSRAAFPTYPPGPAPLAYDSTNHGNGLENLGLFDAVPASPSPVSGQVTFKTPGTYRYVCVVHEGMIGEIKVTA